MDLKEVRSNRSYRMETTIETTTNARCGVKLGRAM